jgi:hypothetical protein
VLQDMCVKTCVKRLVNKASDWTISKNEANQIVWATGLELPFFLSFNQRLCLQIFCEFKLAILFASIANCSEQSRVR